jgi:hypothetical protein
MQIEAIVIYNHGGERRDVSFRTGELNVVTGTNRTGKSTLLDIAEFCLGRSTITMPAGQATAAIGWYGLLVSLPGGGKAFVGRPAPRAGAASSQRAMLEFGADLGLPDHGDLRVNAEAHEVREQLGRRIGIDENRAEQRYSTQPGLAASLGHAVLLCLQGQDEIADRQHLFHRQGEEGLRGAIQDTLPYFIGAVAADQAVKRQELAAARRDLRRAEAELARAEQIAAESDAGLNAVVAEAYTQGLLDSPDIEGRERAILALRTALSAEPPDVAADEQQVARTHEFEERRRVLRAELRRLADERALFADQDSGEHEYEDALRSQIQRLHSLRLLGGAFDAPSNENSGPDDTRETEEPNETGERPADASEAKICPACGSEIADEDADANELRQAVLTLRESLADVHTTRPRRETALTEINQKADEVRVELRSVEAALAGAAANQQASQQARDRTSAQAFAKGRIDQFLATLTATDPHALERLRQTMSNTARRVKRLESELDSERAEDELRSRLTRISHDMSDVARRLKLEHSAGVVALDLRRLTVLVDTDTDAGTVPLFRVGSGENWVGYHLAAHLALHQFFVRHDRPVPRFLMLDQPTQVSYPDETNSGEPEDENSRVIVRRMFEVMRDVVAELDGEFQIIVCDHANLPEPWFQRAVSGNNWRGGTKLVPAEWLDQSS